MPEAVSVAAIGRGLYRRVEGDNDSAAVMESGLEAHGERVTRDGQASWSGYPCDQHIGLPRKNDVTVHLATYATVA